MDEFIEALPAHLNQEVTLAIYKDFFDEHKLFDPIKSHVECSISSALD
jgi:hypothetical protein